MITPSAISRSKRAWAVLRATPTSRASCSIPARGKDASAAINLIDPIEL